MTTPIQEFLDPFEDAHWLPMRDILSRNHYHPPLPATLDETDLTGRLWELIYALAGLRTYLNCTNHLSNRELYNWLDEWLNKPTADIPREAEWNHHVDIIGSGSEKDIELGLRYYNSEEERNVWAKSFPADSIPPHEDPPYDRDRFLPQAPLPLPLVEDPLPHCENEQEDEEADVLGLAEVDRQIQAETLRRVADEPGGDLIDRTGDQGLGKAKEAFPEQIPGHENVDWEKPMDALRKANCSVLPPDELTDLTLTAKLWELLHNLACRGFYVLHTDHLSDRDLYRALWDQGLREEALIGESRSRTSGWFHDFIGSWDEEQTQIWLRYYADGERRARESAESPDKPLPPRQEPPYCRDWRVPKGPF